MNIDNDELRHLFETAWQDLRKELRTAISTIFEGKK